MAQLKSTVVQGSLRVTDTTYTTNLNLASATASRLLKTDDNKNVIAIDMTVGAPSASGNATAFITSVSQGADGKISASKATVPNASTSTAGITKYGTAANTALQGNQVLFKLNNTDTTAASSASFYAPTTGGTKYHILTSNGTAAPVWKATANGAAYATSTNGELTFGTLPIAQGGTGITSTDPHKVLIGPASGNATAPTWRTINYPDIQPTVSKTYAPAKSYGETDAEATCCFFFLSVKPDSWYKGWQVRFKVRTVADSYANVDSTTWCTLNGRADSFIYHNWNERYDIGHYYIVARSLKSAGFNAGLGHMVGVNVRYSTGRGNTAYTRKIYLDYYDCEGCTVTVLDAANLWANLGNTTNYSDTNYNGYTNLDAVNRGLRETGDDNTTSISHLYEQYGGWVAANLLCRYQFVFENADHKLVSVFGTDNAYTTTNKTLLTVEFDPNGRIYYHNTSGTTAANANVDPGRLYYAILADLRYSFNVTQSASSTTFTGVRYTSLYLKTTMNASTGMVHVASSQPLVTSLPTSNDGFYYIYLGQVHDWYRVMMTEYHPVYYHDGTKLVEYMGNNIGSQTANFKGNTASTSTSTGAVTVTGGLGVGGQVTAARVGAGGSNTGYALYANGATFLNGKIVGALSASYGPTLPTSDLTNGRLFFQEVSTEYELPDGGNAGSFLIKNSAADRDVYWDNSISHLITDTFITAGTNIMAMGNIQANGTISGSRVFNAVWNDYAECRSSWIEEPGRVIVESKTGTMELATQRLMAGCKIISDTYGNLMGESSTAKTPVAIAGRVLAYPYQDRDKYELGAAVCSGPNGTVDIMTREEIREYPERILGTVSEIPDYNMWQAGNEENPILIKVKGRIWIYVR